MAASTMTDPMEELFGVPAMTLFAHQELVVQHGTLDRLPSFMRTGPMESIDRLCRHYEGPLQIANGDTSYGVQIPVVGAHASALLRLGLTVYFTELGRSLPQSRAWLERLDACLGLPNCAFLVAFANSAGSGLALHHDRFDQLLIQIRGEKRFRYAPNGFVDNPDVQFSPFAASPAEWGQVYRRGFPSTSDELSRRGLRTETLQPGSALFMPAGTWHTTAGQDGDSLSVVVVVPAPSRLSLVLNLLRYYAGQSPEWRARSYAGWAGAGDTTAREHRTLEDLMVDLGERLRSLPAADAYGAWLSDAFTAGTQREYPRDLRYQRYIRLPNSSARFEPDEAPGRLRCVVRSGPIDRPQAETAVALNNEARPIVDWVLGTRAAFTVAQVCQRFEDFPGDDLEGLLAWMARAALIRPIPVPEWDGPARSSSG
jgi:hypothetical protein